MLGTSKSKQDSKKFELFITTAPIPDLNEKLIVFGRVIKGEDVVQVISLLCSRVACFLFQLGIQMCNWPIMFFFYQEIEEVDTDELYRPKSNILIVDVILKREV